MSPASRLSVIFSDYLKSAIALAAGAPTEAQLQRLDLTTAVAITNPNLLVSVSIDPDGTDELLNGTIELKLTATIGVETGQISRDTAHAYLQALRALLVDTPTAFTAWNEWIITQTTNYRDGWCLQSLYPKPIEEEVKSAENLLILTAPFTFTSFYNS